VGKVCGLSRTMTRQDMRRWSRQWQLQLRESVNCPVYVFRMSKIEMPDGTCGKDLR